MLSEKGISSSQTGQLSAFDISLAVSSALSPDTDIDECKREFERMLNDLRKRLQGKKHAMEIVHTFNKYLFEEKKFQYQSNAHFLGEVLTSKHGSCVGLTTLYVILAQRLGIPCVAVNLPRHLIARYHDDTSRINIEMGANGAEVSDDWFINEYALDKALIRDGIYLRELNEKELSAVVLSNCGNILREAGSLLEAKIYLDRALLLAPRSVDALYSRGITLIQLGHIDEGLKDCDAALALYPGCTFALVNRGMGYFLKGEHTKALAEINKAIKLDSSQSGFYTNRGSVHVAMGQAEKALQDYNQAINLDPMAAEAYCARANLLRDHGAVREALQDYEKALSLSPKNAQYHFNQALACLKMNEMDASMTALNKAIEHNPKFAEAYYNRALILAMNGRYADALQDCGKALALLPESGTVFLVRAMVYALAKDQKKAFKDLRKALALDPNLRPVSERNEAFGEWWDDTEFKRIFQ